MNMTFDVGNVESHRVDFEFNKFWGTMRLAVDDAPVIREIWMFSLKRA